MTARLVAQRTWRVRPSLHAKRWQSTSPAQSRFTVSGSGSQDELVHHLAANAGRNSAGEDALVILASRSYAKWLTNPDFMAQFLSTVAGTGAAQEINVLAAAVDGLLPHAPFTKARHGLSVCQGRVDHLLPDLWSGTAASKLGRDTDSNAAIFFNTGHSLQSARIPASHPLTVTLPLANTIFQNNRQSTLLASRWRRPTTDGPLQLEHMVSKQTQHINCGTDSTPQLPAAEVHLPIGPVTTPRVIVAGLGNIVRQIDVDGTPTPASRELEAAVQEVYDRWAAHGHRLQGPLSVWAVVIPPSAVDDAGIAALSEWQRDMAGRPDMESELQATEQAASHIVPLLQRGARVYRVLSGGGGWGKKAGLLSLDPDTKFALPGEEGDLDSFMRSFAGEHGGTSEGDVVAPGSTIQYFVQPLLEEKRGISAGGEESFPSGCVFGTSRWVGEDPFEGGKGWTTVQGLFGGVSEQGLYISESNGQEGEDGLVQTKINVPGAFIAGQRK